MNVNNTNVTLGVFDGESLRATWRFATDMRKQADEYGVLILSLLEHGGLSAGDIGTATVFDAISREGAYIGGAIAPGLGIGSEALFQRAAKLYRVELSRPGAAIGRNTIGAMQAGIVFRHVGLVGGIVARFKEELGEDARVIGTGGYA